MSLDDLKLPKNNLFKFSCRDHHDSANYTFTWELTPRGSAALQEAGIRFPFMYVFAVEELPAKKVESHAEGCGCKGCGGHNKLVEDALFCLHEGAGQLQFHKSGEFRIYAMVIWDFGNADSNWKSQRRHVLSEIRNWNEPILQECADDIPKGFTLWDIVEDAVHIGASFFAKPPNPTLWWWANLWWDSKPANTCDYKKRLWFVLWIQLITVSIYAVLRGIAMFLAFLGSMLIAFRLSHVHWRPMFHPFSSTWGQMFDFGESEANWATRAKGADTDRRVPSILIRMPFVWIGGPIGLYYLVGAIRHHPWIYLGAAIGVVFIVALAFGLLYASEVIKSRRKSVPLYYELVPIEEPKRRRVPLKVRWLDAKGKLCLPFPK